jgi:hypothetical protein
MGRKNKPEFKFVPLTEHKHESKTGILNFTDALKHKEETRDEMLHRYAGVKGMNPYKWNMEVVAPLEDRYVAGERSKELYDALMNLKIVEPRV